MKQTELHRHLDVSVRLSTLLELAQTKGLEATSTSLDAFRDKLVIHQPMKDLNTVLAQFSLFQKVLDRPEILERVAYEVVEDCYRDGTRRVELRFSPSFVTEYNSMQWDDVLGGFERGMNRALQAFPDMQAGLICIATRDFGLDGVAETVEFFLKHQKRFAGLDLAGNEKDFPCRLFEAPYRKAAAAGARITIHAGEGAGPDNMWEAIELLGAKRIGHGIACIQDAKLMDYLAKNRICLEVCPTSNYLTRSIISLDRHPLPQILAAGIPVCINTDDPTIFGVSLSHELAVCREQIGLTETDLARCQEYAWNSSFLY